MSVMSQGNGRSRSLIWFSLVAVVIAGGIFLKLRSDAREAAEVAARDQASEDVQKHFESFVSGRRSPTKVELFPLGLEVDRRIREAGYSPWQDEIAQRDPVDRWAAFQKHAAERTAFHQETARVEAEAKSKCAPVFGEDCEAMVEAWICLTRSNCSEGAIEGLHAAVFEAGYLEDEISDYCYDSIDRSEVCYADEEPMQDDFEPSGLRF